MVYNGCACTGIGHLFRAGLFHIIPFAMKFFGWSRDTKVHDDVLPPTRRSWLRLTLSLHGAANMISLFTLGGGITHLVQGIIGFKNGEAVPHLATIHTVSGVFYLVASAMGFLALSSRINVPTRQHTAYSREIGRRFSSLEHCWRQFQ
jgi:hypothetical protein